MPPKTVKGVKYNQEKKYLGLEKKCLAFSCRNYAL